MPAPFIATLISLERGENDVTFEVEVANVSGNVEAIPRSVDWSVWKE